MYYEKAYLVGQISKDLLMTYKWRENIRKYFKKSKRIDIIDPCFNGFNQSLLDDKEIDPQRLTVYQQNGTDLLVPKDYSYVLKSTIGIANMNHYDPKKPMLGTIYELAWYYANPEKTVIGIFDGDPTKDIHCNHPFVRSTIDTWVKDEIEACKIIEYFYLNKGE